jgi:ribonuclease Z
MPKLIVLGSASAIANERHDNTHLALVGEERSVLIDCANNPLLNLRRANVHFHVISDLILTHFHPDHVSGLAPFLMDMWLLGRTEPLHIHGLTNTIERATAMMDLYDWKSWPSFYPVTFHPLDMKSLTPVMMCQEFQIFASPVKHFIPTIGLRIEFIPSGKIFAYSCDTEPCSEVIGLARNADVLFHEAAVHSDDVQMRFEGHSTAYQAGEIASQANASVLYLIHYATNSDDFDVLISSAQRVFKGKVYLAEDLMEINF